MLTRFEILFYFRLEHLNLLPLPPRFETSHRELRKNFWPTVLITFIPTPPPRIETSHGELRHCRDFAVYRKVPVSFVCLFVCFFVKTMTLPIWENADLPTFDFHCQFTLYFTIILSKPPSQYITTETCTGTLNSDYCSMSKRRLSGHLAFLHLEDWAFFAFSPSIP